MIGWSYLVACSVYSWLGKNTAAMIGMVGLLYRVFFAGQAGFFSGRSWLTQRVGVGDMLGSHAGITLSGVFWGRCCCPNRI